MTFSITRLYRNQLGRDYQSHAGISGQLSGSEFGIPKNSGGPNGMRKTFFRWMIWMVILFPKIVKLRLVWSFFRSFWFWFWMILDEFNLMIEKLKRRKLLGISIASEPSYILPKHWETVPKSWRSTIHTSPGRFARRTPLWIWTLDLEKPWLLWWAPWWWNSSHISSWNFCCWQPVGICNVIKTFEIITGIIKWEPFGVGQAWWSFWRGPFALVPSLGWQYNDPCLNQGIDYFLLRQRDKKILLCVKDSGNAFSKSTGSNDYHSGVNKHGWMGTSTHFDRYLVFTSFLRWGFSMAHC